MKKIFALTLCMALLLSAFGMISASAAAGTTVNGVTYSIDTTDNVAYVSSGAAATGYVQIPGNITIGGRNYEVKYIASDAFRDNLDITRVDFDNKYVYSRAFYGCENLKYVVADQALINISVDAFIGCYSLRGVRFIGPCPLISTGAFIDYGTDVYVFTDKGFTYSINTFPDNHYLIDPRFNVTFVDESNTQLLKSDYPAEFDPEYDSVQTAFFTAMNGAFDTNTYDYTFTDENGDEFEFTNDTMVTRNMIITVSKTLIQPTNTSISETTQETTGGTTEDPTEDTTSEDPTEEEPTEEPTDDGDITMTATPYDPSPITVTTTSGGNNPKTGVASGAALLVLLGAGATTLLVTKKRK